eukprot:jgi/Undpi1/4629/HiC_scaffold_18.g07983.m1
MANLHQRCATPHELAVVSRICPDQSAFVKALSGLGKAQALWIEFHRRRLRKESRFSAFVRDDPYTHPSLRDSQAYPKRMRGHLDDEEQRQKQQQQALTGALALEACGSHAYNKGLRYLHGAIQKAETARTMASGAEAKIALAELHQQGVQFLAVSIDNRRAWMKEKAGDIGRLTSTGKKLIQLGTAVCREVIGSPLESVRERYAERARSSMERLSGLEVQLHELTKKEVKLVMAAAADTGNSGGVTQWYQCPNGHTYGVGDCGMLNGIGNCIECGETIAEMLMGLTVMFIDGSENAATGSP